MATKLGEFGQKMQVQVKRSTMDLVLFAVRFVSGGIIGLTFALAGQTLFGYGSFLFAFVVFTNIGIVLRMSKSWGLVGILVFDLVMVLLAMLLRMYILMAPEVGL